MLCETEGWCGKPEVQGFRLVVPWFDNVCNLECTSALVIIRSLFDFKVLKIDLFLFPRRGSLSNYFLAAASSSSSRCFGPRVA